MDRRNTIQKQLVLNAVNNLKNHATAEEIHINIAADNPQISKGTVYRNLGILSEEGQIRRLEIPGSADCYDHIPDKHYHIRCIKCGKVFDVDMNPVPSPIKNISDTRGFDFLDYDIVFKGICPKCKNIENTEEK